MRENLNIPNNIEKSIKIPGIYITPRILLVYLNGRRSEKNAECPDALFAFNSTFIDVFNRESRVRYAKSRETHLSFDFGLRPPDAANFLRLHGLVNRGVLGRGRREGRAPTSI